MRRLAVCLFVLPVAYGLQAEAQALRDLPSAAKIDHRIHLSPQDRDQIARLIADKTPQHVDGVWWDGPDKILVYCGYNDLLHGKHPVEGDAFILRRLGSHWKIIEQPNWSGKPPT